MSAANRAESAEQRIASQGKITNGVQHLVANEFEWVAKPLAVHDTAFADGDSVGQVGAKGQSGLPEALNVGHEAERTGPRQLVAENARAHFVGQALTTDDRRVEIDFNVQMETSVRGEFAPA